MSQFSCVGNYRCVPIGSLLSFGHGAASRFAPVHQAVMPGPASSYQTLVGVQPTSNLALIGNQQSNMGNQMQGVMVQYPPMQSYQVLPRRGSVMSMNMIG